MKPFKDENKLIEYIADFFYTDYQSIKRSVVSNDIDIIKLYELIESEDLIHRRNEFYSLFKRENSADHYWTKIWKVKEG